MSSTVKEISQQESSLPVPRSFLLAMLKITDDYFKLLKDFEDFKDSAEERSKRLVEILDNSLKEKEALGFDEGTVVTNDGIKVFVAGRIGATAVVGLADTARAMNKGFIKTAFVRLVRFFIAEMPFAEDAGGVTS